MRVLIETLGSWHLLVGGQDEEDPALPLPSPRLSVGPSSAVYGDLTETKL